VEEGHASKKEGKNGEKGRRTEKESEGNSDAEEHLIRQSGVVAENCMSEGEVVEKVYQ
jgi:hypothetical protein